MSKNKTLPAKKNSKLVIRVKKTTLKLKSAYFSNSDLETKLPKQLNPINVSSGVSSIIKTIGFNITIS